MRILAHAALSALLLTALAAAGCQDAGATITRLTVGAPGPDPYLRVAGTDRQPVARAATTGSAENGDTPGLYGGTRRSSDCGQDRMVAYLQADPAKAKAWAQAHRIAPADIPRYVRQLTPVLLRTDTLVTNHGYKDGEATSFPAVLHAGMGVLVDRYGVPVVKCNCGNPLTAPEKKISPENAEFKGPSWPGFRPQAVTHIRNGAPVASFVLVHPDGTVAFERPVATDGGADGPPEPPPAGTRPPGGPGTPKPDTSPGPGGPSKAPPDKPGTPGGPGGGTPRPGDTGERPGGPGTPDRGPGGGEPDGPGEPGDGGPGGGEPGGGKPGAPDRRQPGQEQQQPPQQQQPG